MVTTFTFALTSSYFPSVGAFFNDPIVLSSSLIVMLPVLCTLYCSRSIRESVPINYAFLGVFTICESVSIGSLTSNYEPVSVLTSIAAFCVITGSLWMVALHTKLST